MVGDLALFLIFFSSREVTHFVSDLCLLPTKFELKIYGFGLHLLTAVLHGIQIDGFKAIRDIFLCSPSAELKFSDSFLIPPSKRWAFLGLDLRTFAIVANIQLERNTSFFKSGGAQEFLNDILIKGFSIGCLYFILLDIFQFHIKKKRTKTKNVGYLELLQLGKSLSFFILSLLLVSCYRNTRFFPLSCFLEVTNFHSLVKSYIIKSLRFFLDVFWVYKKY